MCSEYENWHSRIAEGNEVTGLARMEGRVLQRKLVTFARALLYLGRDFIATFAG